ncbi:MAG: transcriptional regulator [Actinomycetota bacterium]|nr:transcriptional regulator [Actinomycetota bacterium]
MTASSDPRTLALHSLRLKGFADAAAVSASLGLPEAEATALLEQFVADELATKREGRLSGYTLTPAGRAEHLALLTAELEATGAQPAIHDAYTRFLKINGDLLGICTAWQLREVDGESIINDHSDPAHDAAVIEQLADLHANVSPICDDLGAALPRFANYRERLGSALAKVQAGEVDWFTKPMIPSYHTVWFELHEDLLATLGIDRASEGQH